MSRFFFIFATCPKIFMEKKELTITTLSHSLAQSQNYAVILGEINGNKKLPILIGSFEAQAIAVAMENMEPNRPLTHDLFKNVLVALNVVLKEVIISNLIEGIFYSQLVCLQNGKEILVDSRTSDAIALAVRFKCPIFAYQNILDEAGVVLENENLEDEDDDDDMINEDDPLGNYSQEDLQDLLNDALSNEDYEQAAIIRDEINKRIK